MLRSPKPTPVFLSLCLLAACADPATAPEHTTSRATEAAAAVENRWVTRGNLPSDERVDLTTAVVENQSGQSVLYAIGGQSATGGKLTRVQAYNVATNTWSNRAPLPQARYLMNSAAVIQGKIYVAGGLRGNHDIRSELFVYDPVTNKWTEKSPMPTQGFRGRSGVIDDKLYVVTDCEQEDCFPFFNRALYRYDPATDRWTVLAPPNFYHGWGYGGAIAGKFYVTGGTNVLEIYDPTTNTWSTGAPLPRRRWLGGSVTLGGELYLIGGFEEQANGGIEVIRRTSVYNPVSNTWTTRAPVPISSIGMSASRVLLGGKPRIHLVGGLRPGNNRAFLP